MPGAEAKNDQLSVESSESLFGIQHPQRLNGLEIPLKLLLRSALAKTVGFGDAVVAEVLRRFFLMATVAVS